MPVSCLCQLSPFWLVVCHKMAVFGWGGCIKPICSSASCLCNMVSCMRLYICVHRWNCIHVYIHAHSCARLCLSNAGSKHFPHVQSCQTYQFLERLKLSVPPATASLTLPDRSNWRSPLMWFTACQILIATQNCTASHDGALLLYIRHSD